MHTTGAFHAFFTIGICHGFISDNRPIHFRSHSKTNTSLSVSELHIPGYRESKKQFILTDNDLICGYEGGAPVLTRIEQWSFSDADYSSLIPYQNGYLLHKTNRPLFSPEECQYMIDEAEDVRS